MKIKNILAICLVLLGSANLAKSQINSSSDDPIRVLAIFASP